jgi:hypothetical protein
VSDIAPIVLALYTYVVATADIIGAAWHPALKGEADNARCAYRHIGEFTVPIISFQGFFYFRSVSPISGVRIAGPIVLVQHKGHERIGKPRMPIRRALPIVIEIAY